MPARSIRLRSTVLALLCGALPSGCPSDPTAPDDADVDATGRDAAVDSGAPSDAASPDAGFVDAAEDATVDANVDAALACPMDSFPMPSAPPCTNEEATCFRPCADRACVSDCTMTVTVDCRHCVENANFNCALEWCSSELSAWACCRESSCPPSGPCPACDPERDAVRSCWDAAFVPHCRDALEVCFP
jgi:hypothetical protein